MERFESFAMFSDVFVNFSENLNEMNRLPPIQGQSTLKQLETIANEADQSATVISPDQSASLTATDQSAVPEKKPRRRRRKKKPDQSQSAVEGRVFAKVGQKCRTTCFLSISAFLLLWIPYPK